MFNQLITDAYIGLGSNLLNPLLQVTSAIERLDLIEHTDLHSSSSLYLSRPMGPPDQPPYVNAVAWLKTRLNAHSLLLKLQAIENEYGRTRNGEHWGPRTLDLDILVYGNYTLKSQTLSVPHPGIKSREFVLYPLHEVNKNLIIPNLGAIHRIQPRCYANGLTRLPI
ncbi:MAG: 2-amino-4-hydroxy-6-hydroxymethyldihydropteridine diphosphokinase [Gammaproteobacteria bacterium]|nr:2-amino-4-hydroxy-6-hydroxymethyldihydropteridine diphosphokinase [Gammaproteobacteria bacterium]